LAHSFYCLAYELLLEIHVSRIERGGGGVLKIHAFLCFQICHDPIRKVAMKNSFGHLLASSITEKKSRPKFQKM
jgi:hypothetical protein